MNRDEALGILKKLMLHSADPNAIAKDEFTTSDMAAEMSISVSAARTRLKTLEKSGFVTCRRATIPSGGRVFAWRLKGEDLVGAAPTQAGPGD